MSLGFKCPRCGNQILVQYLEPGDEAVCQRCGERVVVPESAVPTDRRPDYQPEEPGPGMMGGGSKPPGGPGKSPEVEELASRLSRLIAAIVDALVMMTFAVPLYAVLIGKYGGSILDSGDAYRITWIGIPSLIYFIGINSYFWATRGQSLGKMVLGVRIVQIDGERATWGRIVGLRIMPMQLLSWIPYIGGIISLVDVLFIFRANRRCLHDEIARTKVVRCGYHPEPERRTQWQRDLPTS
jgi:uncharacterized RDD family membrane protein YckC/DNA-directed RNA polymerase subunit RPC12/RpoP